MINGGLKHLFTDFATDIFYSVLHNCIIFFVPDPNAGHTEGSGKLWSWPPSRGQNFTLGVSCLFCCLHFGLLDSVWNTFCFAMSILSHANLPVRQVISCQSLLNCTYFIQRETLGFLQMQGKHELNEVVFAINTVRIALWSSNQTNRTQLRSLANLASRQYCWKGRSLTRIPKRFPVCS